MRNKTEIIHKIIINSQQKKIKSNSNSCNIIIIDISKNKYAEVKNKIRIRVHILFYKVLTQRFLMRSRAKY